jgi:hypothetical protein
MLNGFIDNNHRVACEASRERHRRGGENADICGAKTRRGSSCRMPPLRGHWRCLRHAGPKAARVHRERQLKDLAAGRLEPEVFARAEARRARNRLQRAWKQDVWTPGTTIGLGKHEDAFQQALQLAGLRSDEMPPAIIDQLRWRFRRCHLDRPDLSRWARAVAEGHSRLAAAASPPEHSKTPTTGAPHCAPERLSPWSRRRKPDQARAPLARQAGRSTPTISTRDADQLWEFMRKHRSDIAPVLTRCREDADKLRIAAAYHGLLKEGATAAAHHAWHAALKSLEDEPE